MSMTVATSSYKVLANPSGLETRSVKDPISYEDIILQFKTEGDFPKLAKVVKLLSPEPSVKVGETFVVFKAVGSDVMSLSRFREYFKAYQYTKKEQKTFIKETIDFKPENLPDGFGSMEEIYRQELGELSTKEEVLDYLKEEVGGIFFPSVFNTEALDEKAQWLRIVTELALDRLNEFDLISKRDMVGEHAQKTNEDLINELQLIDKYGRGKTTFLGIGVMLCASTDFFKLLGHSEMAVRTCPISNQPFMVEKIALESMGEIAGYELFFEGERKTTPVLAANNSIYQLDRLKEYYKSCVDNSSKIWYPNTSPGKKIDRQHLQLLGVADVEASLSEEFRTLCKNQNNRLCETAPELFKLFTEIVANGWVPKSLVTHLLKSRPPINALTNHKFFIVGPESCLVDCLILACIHNKPKVIDELEILQHINNDTQGSPLYFAVKYQSYEAAEALFKRGYALSQDKGGKHGDKVETCMAAAIRLDDSRMIALLKGNQR